MIIYSLTQKNDRKKNIFEQDPPSSQSTKVTCWNLADRMRARKGSNAQKNIKQNQTNICTYNQIYGLPKEV